MGLVEPQDVVSPVAEPDRFPVVVGGGGGSGTRVIAQIMQQCGYFMGTDLNHAHDNLWFTLLFRRPGWYRRATRSQVRSVIKVFDRAMMSKPWEAPHRMRIILRAMLPMIYSGSDHKHQLRGKWPMMHGWRLWSGEVGADSGTRKWGWKEPNSHVYLPHLVEYYPLMKYVHVIRHGLDMALSSNQAQLYNWGSRFGVEPPKTKQQEPRASLEYWVRSNREAITFGTERLGERFILVNFDRLCTSPVAEVGRLVRFLGAPMSDQQIHDLAAIPRRPASTARYKSQDLSVFGPDPAGAVRRFGFDCES